MPDAKLCNIFKASTVVLIFCAFILNSILIIVRVSDNISTPKNEKLIKFGQINYDSFDNKNVLILVSTIIFIVALASYLGLFLCCGPNKFMIGYSFVVITSIAFLLYSYISTIIDFEDAVGSRFKMYLIIQILTICLSSIIVFFYFYISFRK